MLGFFVLCLFNRHTTVEEIRRLSQKAIDDLRFVLQNEIGHSGAQKLSDTDINNIGDFLLTLFVESIKQEKK